MAQIFQSLYVIISNLLFKRVRIIIPIILMIILALLIYISYNLNSDILRRNQIQSTIYYYNSILHEINIKMKFNSMIDGKTDNIKIETKSVDLIADSIYSNFGRSTFAYLIRDTLNNDTIYKFQDLDNLRIVPPSQTKSNIFQKRIYASFFSNVDCNISFKVEEPQKLSNDIDTFYYENNKVYFNKRNKYSGSFSVYPFNGKMVIESRKITDTFPSLSKPLKDTLLFSSGNLVCVNVVNDKKKHTYTYDYYIKYKKDVPDVLYNDSEINGKLFTSNNKGDINCYIKFNISANKIDKAVNNPRSVISFESDRLIMDNINIYPEPDQKTLSGFRYTSPERIKEVLKEGIMLKGILPGKKKIYADYNFWVTFLIGAIITTLITILISYWNTWLRKKSNKRKVVK